ncbi:MAG TPA: SPFH domain-containing protein [Sideroxyarcus sp.]|nr:SPFH domain-containing protein [Sideroxyarcus sp.]
MKKLITLLLVAVVAVGCTRIETGEVGLRVGFDKQVALQELSPGSFNQVIIGDVLTFPVRDIAVNLDDLRPQTQDNSTLSEMDMTVIYSINPAAVGELYTAKARAFHAEGEDGDTYLMFNYMVTVARTAAYKAAAKFPAMDSVRKRDEIESETTKLVQEALKAEKLDTALTLTKVQVRAITPAQTIIDTANDAIAAQNRLVTVKKQVEIAEQEAKRQELLSRPANIAYMKAQAELNISEGVRDGKVSTIVIPSQLTMLGGVK